MKIIVIILISFSTLAFSNEEISLEDYGKWRKMTRKERLNEFKRLPENKKRRLRSRMSKLKKLSPKRREKLKEIYLDDEKRELFRKSFKKKFRRSDD